jgi:hypothetical protein
MRNAGVTAAAVVIVVSARWLWPAEPGAQAVADWQEGVYDLQAGEPVAAAERATAQHRLPPVAHAYLAWPWHELDLPPKPKRSFPLPHRKPLQSEADRLFEQAAAAELRTTGAGARDPGTQRKRRYGIGRLGVHRRPTRPPHGGDEWKRVAARFRIIRPRICGGPKRRRSKANGSRLSGSSSWRKRISMRLATPTWCAPCPRAAASRAWKAATWIKPAPTCPRSSACNLACRIPAMGLATEPSR